MSQKIKPTSITTVCQFSKDLFHGSSNIFGYFIQMWYTKEYNTIDYKRMLLNNLDCESTYSYIHHTLIVLPQKYIGIVVL